MSSQCLNEYILQLPLIICGPLGMSPHTVFVNNYVALGLCGVVMYGWLSLRQEY